jgi:hypothetical protein
MKKLYELLTHDKLEEIMSDAKKELEMQREKIVIKMKDWQGGIQRARNEIDDILRVHMTNIDEGLRENLNKINNELWKVSESIQRAVTDLEHLQNFFNFEKSNLEVRKSIIDCWPTKTWIKNLILVSYAIFAAGSASLAFGELVRFQPWIAIVFWTMGFFLLAIAFYNLWEEDNKKWNFFKKEFGILSDLEEPVRFERLSFTAKEDIGFAILLTILIAFWTTGLSLLATGLITYSGGSLVAIISGIVLVFGGILIYLFRLLPYLKKK